MAREYTNVLEKIKPVSIGEVNIVHDSPDKLTRLRASMHGQPLTKDTYVRLFVNGELVMTDTEFERMTNADIISKAKGDALIAGLGIGLILDPVIKRCSSVTVVEKSADVIKVVGPQFETTNIVHADIFKWKPAPGVKFDTIYFDIWPDICTDDIDEATNLRSRFKPYLRSGGYMRSWTTIANAALRNFR